MRQRIAKMLGLLPNRDAVSELSHEELVALVILQREELEKKDKQIEALQQALEAQRLDYEHRLEAQRIEYEARLESQRLEYEARLDALQRQVNVLLRKLNTNSTNSGIPSSKDPIGFDRAADKDDKSENDKKDPPTTGNKRSRGGQKGHKGHGVRRYIPEQVDHLHPTQCSCGCCEFVDEKHSRLHQWVEMPRIEVMVRHFQLWKGRCRHCGKLVKAQLPAGYATGYGPRMTATIGLMHALGSTTRQIRSFFESGLFVTKAGESIKLPLGMVSKLLGRTSNALKAHYEAIGEVARVAPINHVDETSWPTFGPEGKRKNWLWIMVSGLVAFFMVHPHRSEEAFRELIGDWEGFLVSDDYALYRKWDPENRQSCLAHLIRTAKKLSEDPDRDIAKWGARLHKELQRLAQMSKQGPTRGVWQAWVMRIKRLFRTLKERDDNLGNLVLRLYENFPSLYTFLRVHGVEPTNNHAERSLRPAVVRRKVSYGSTDECGLRRIERIFSVVMTCRLNKWSFADLIQEAVRSFLFGEPQDLSRYDELKRQAIEARAKLGLDPATP